MNRAWPAKLAALVALCVQLTGLRWGEPFPCDVSPDSVWPIRSLLSFERFPFGALPTDKYPDAWALVTGATETLAARVLLTADERTAITALRERVEAAAKLHAGEATFDTMRPLIEESGGLERPLWKLVLAGRVTTLAAAVVLSLCASAIASELVGASFGWIAGLLIGLAPATAHYAATLNTDVPSLAWVALAWLLAMRGARGAKLSTYLASGAAMGLAAATKDQVVALLPGVVWIALVLRCGDPDAACGPRRDVAWPRRLLAIVLGSALAYLPTSGLLHVDPIGGLGASWTSHVRFVLHEGSQNYREFERSLGGALRLLGACGGKLLTAGAVAGGGGLAALLLLVGARRDVGPLTLLLPAASYVALFLVPIGYVYPRFVLPIVLCTSIGFAVAIGRFAQFARPKFGPVAGVALAAAVAFAALVEARGVVVTKRSDPRPASLSALAARRADGDSVWVFAQSWFMAPWPPIAPPRRLVTLAELTAGLRSSDGKPRFVWLAVDSHGELAKRPILESEASRLGLRLLDFFEPESSCRLADDRNGLLLPTVALFEVEAK